MLLSERGWLPPWRVTRTSERDDMTTANVTPNVIMSRPPLPTEAPSTDHRRVGPTADALAHFARYLANPTGECLFVFEPAYRHIARGLAAAGGPVDDIVEIACLDAASVGPDALSEMLGTSPVCFAFDRRYGTSRTRIGERLAELARNRQQLTFTLCDCADRFDQLFAVPPERITELNRGLLARLIGTEGTMHVKDGNGTDLYIELSSEYDWVSIDGFEERRHDLTINLPPGEVATFPASVNGSVQFTGALLGTIPIGRKHGYVSEPVTLTIEASRVVEIRAADDALRRDLEFCLRHAPFADHVCEIGLGTHPAIRSLVGLNYTFEEKHYGFHMGFGASLAQQNVERVTDHHLDLLFDRCVVEVGGEILFDGDEYSGLCAPGPR